MTSKTNKEQTMTAQAKLGWMNDAIWSEDPSHDDPYREFARDVDNISATAGGYPERHADAIGRLYSEMRSA